MELTVEKIQKAMDKMPFPSPYTAEDWLEHLYLENYHCHKDFSNVCVTDCAESIENYAQRIKEYGSGQCLYSGEHGSQGNQFHVYKVAEQNGLEYRHSSEVYWVKDRHEKDRSNCHMILVAKNDEGRKELNYILSVANEDGYYFQPRIDLELLFSLNPDNFFATSSCVFGWKYEDADEVWLKVANYFGENFFFEVQNHDSQSQKELNERILRLSQEHHIPIICGLDTHYVLEENKLKRQYMIEDKRKKKGQKTQEEDLEAEWFMDYPDTKTVIERFEKQGVLNEEQILEAILNTNVFVNECEEITFDRHFKIPNIYKDLDYEGRVKLFKQKINQKYKEDPHKSKEKEDGIRWEVEQLVDSGVVDYPLVSEVIVKNAVDNHNGIITTTSRGSSSAFITNNYMGLTTIDRFNSDVPLIPERFVSKDRILSGSMPDADNNIASQEPFIEAARDLLGEHGCYPLMTLQTYKEKSAWLMYARVNKVPASESLALSKDLDEFNKAIKYADEDEIEFIHVEDYISPDYLDLYRRSIPYQGITTKSGVHSCGNLIFDGDIRREVGLISAKSESTEERTLVAAVEGKYLDEFGYVKEDFLIVDAVSLTKEMFDSIGKPVPTFEQLKEMVKHDPKTWEIYSKGITCCVNQMEKESTTKKAMKYKPQSIAELASLIAGIRPGFASLINNFLNRKPYSTGEEKIDKILESSSHYMLYQESIMAVLSFLGMPMTETYSVIKAISKKKLKGEKKEKLLKELQEAWFKEFGNMDNFNKVWKVIEDAASYSFNACVSGDTKIQKGWGKVYAWNPTVEEMYKTMHDYVWAFNNGHEKLHIKMNDFGWGKALSMSDEGKLFPNQIIDIRQSGVKDIYRVMTESGAYVDCTLDHKIPTVDKGILLVEDLQVGDKLYVRGQEATGRVNMGYFVIPTAIKAIEYLKTDMTYDVEMADPCHNFLTWSGLVVSNCHAYAMAGDSLYFAWFKAHHPEKFYEVAITHYQKKKNSKKKIDKLIKEVTKFYGYKIGSYEFGADNRRVNLDAENKILYPNLSAIKGFGEKVVSELYDVGLKEYSNFREVYDAIKKTTLNATQLTNLAKLGYFNKYGNESEILEKIKIYEFARNIKKSVGKDQLEKNNFPLAYALPFGRETKTRIMDFDKEGFIDLLVEKIDVSDPTDHQRLYWQWFVTGLVDSLYENIPIDEYFITKLVILKAFSVVTAYSPSKGKSIDVKVWNKVFDRNPIQVGDFIKLYKFERQVKTEPSDKLKPNGKPIYVPVKSGETEPWLRQYAVINNSVGLIKETKNGSKNSN